jgi:hypothetical protein
MFRLLPPRGLQLRIQVILASRRLLPRHLQQWRWLALNMTSRASGSTMELIRESASSRVNPDMDLL